MRKVEGNIKIIPEVQIFGEITRIQFEQFEGGFAHKEQSISTNLRTIRVMEQVDWLNERRKAKNVGVFDNRKRCTRPFNSPSSCKFECLKD